jgi:hypothetical protein
VTDLLLSSETRQWSMAMLCRSSKNRGKTRVADKLRASYFRKLRMNAKKIIFSGIITMTVGTGLGLVIVHLAPCPYESEFYKSLKDRYLAIGGVAGLLLGSSLEAVRQLKKERDREEAIAARHELIKSAFLQLNSDGMYEIRYVDKERT